MPEEFSYEDAASWSPKDSKLTEKTWRQKNRDTFATIAANGEPHFAAAVTLINDLLRTTKQELPEPETGVLWSPRNDDLPFMYGLRWEAEAVGGSFGAWKEDVDYHSSIHLIVRRDERKPQIFTTETEIEIYPQIQEPMYRKAIDHGQYDIVDLLTNPAQETVFSAKIQKGFRKAYEKANNSEALIEEAKAKKKEIQEAMKSIGQNRY